MKALVLKVLKQGPKRGSSDTRMNGVFPFLQIFCCDPIASSRYSRGFTSRV